METKLRPEYIALTLNGEPFRVIRNGHESTRFTHEVADCLRERHWPKAPRVREHVGANAATIAEWVDEELSRPHE